MGEDDAETDATDALHRRLAATDTEPTCAICTASADFFLFDPDRVAKFVCWEHVSPVSASVSGDLETADRPVALPLTEEFG